MAQPLKIIFAKDLQKNLYPKNEFYKNSVDDSSMIDGTKVVLPQAGAPPDTIKNPVDFPLALNSRVDGSEEYPLDLYATKPTHVRIDENLVVAYDKRVAILEDHKSSLNTKIADGMADVWFPDASLGATNYVRTTGAAVSTLAPGATGTRKAVALADFVKVVTLMDNMEIPEEDRYGLIPSTMYGDLVLIPEFMDYQKRGLVDLIAKGWIGEIMGVKIYKRSRAGVYSNAGTPAFKPSGSSIATTDNLSALFWQKGMVRRGEGEVKIFIKENDPQLLGSAFNAAVRAGGRRSRTDGKGVISLIQSHP